MIAVSESLVGHRGRGNFEGKGKYGGIDIFWKCMKTAGIRTATHMEIEAQITCAIFANKTITQLRPIALGPVKCHSNRS